MSLEKEEINKINKKIKLIFISMTIGFIMIIAFDVLLEYTNFTTNNTAELINLQNQVGKLNRDLENFNSERDLEKIKLKVNNLENKITEESIKVNKTSIKVNEAFIKIDELYDKIGQQEETFEEIQLEIQNLTSSHEKDFLALRKSVDMNFTKFIKKDDPRSHIQLGNGNIGTEYKHVVQWGYIRNDIAYIHLRFENNKCLKYNGDSCMFYLHITGYAFATGTNIDLVVSGYKTFPSNGGPIMRVGMSDVTGKTQDKLVYHGSDNHLYVRFAPFHRKLYFLSFSVDSKNTGGHTVVKKPGDLTVIHSSEALL